MFEEEDVFNALSGFVSQSKHGGYYLFLPDYNVRVVDSHMSSTIWGKITAHGNIKNIIKNKSIEGQLITEWLAGWTSKETFKYYVQKTDIYAGHILYTWPEPGGYWQWASM